MKRRNLAITAGITALVLASALAALYLAPPSKSDAGQTTTSSSSFQTASPSSLCDGWYSDVSYPIVPLTNMTKTYASVPLGGIENFTLSDGMTTITVFHQVTLSRALALIPKGAENGLECYNP